MKKAIGVMLLSVKHKKIILAVAMLFAVNILIIALAQSADAALYKRGSSGATVTQIQTRLKSWGYYSGSVDGIYGSATESAVKYFQRKNGLSVDGQAGDKTLAALGIYEPPSSALPRRATCIYLRDLYPPRRAASRISGRSRSGRSSSTGSTIRRSQTRCRASYINAAHSPALTTGSLISQLPTAPIEPRARP